MEAETVPQNTVTQPNDDQNASATIEALQASTKVVVNNVSEQVRRAQEAYYQHHGHHHDPPSFGLFMITFITSFLSPMCFVVLQKFGPSIFRITTLFLMLFFGISFGI